MKTEKKAYLFLLIMICIVIFACGCKNNAGKDTVSDTAFSLTKENLSQYLIIIPDKSDSKMLDERIKKQDNEHNRNRNQDKKRFFGGRF